MGEVPRGVRPETEALNALIQATIADALETGTQASGDTMLFLGNRHHAFPALVVRDPVLEPVDKVVWMVIMVQAAETGGSTAFPTFETIAQAANVASTTTVSRAIAILRITRWLTLCARLRAKSGRFRGNVYALHDEPLPLVDALHLDPDYMEFLQTSLAHHHARVRRVAQAVLDTIDADILVGRELCAPAHPIEQRLQATEALQSDTPRRYFAFNAAVIPRLRNQGEETATDHQDQNLTAVESPSRNGHPQILHPQNLKVRSSSCSNNQKITTTTTADAKIEGYEAGGQLLVYPRRLSVNQQGLADRYLRIVPAEDRQAILDELEGRFRSEQKGMKPVYDEIRFLNYLCQAALKGRFVPNLGLAVREERLERARAGRKPPGSPARGGTATDEPQKRRSRETGRKQLAAVRKALTRPARAKSTRKSPPR